MRRSSPRVPGSVTASSTADIISPSQTQPAIRQPNTKKPPGAEFITVIRSMPSGMTVMPSQVPLPMISRMEDISTMVRI